EYQIDHGFDPFTGELIDDRRADYHIIDGVDTIDPQDVSTQLQWCSLNQSLEEAISEAISLDKMCPIIDGYNLYIDTGLYKPCEEQDFDNSGDNLIIDGVDTINSTDVFNEIFWTDRNLTFEQALEQASFLDRFCPFLNENNNSFNFFFYDLGENINDYYRMVCASNDYEFMKVEEPDCIDEGELKFMLAQDLEYYFSLKSKTLDVYVSDISEVMELLERPLGETIYRLIVHWNGGENRFIIVITDIEQYYSYKVALENETHKIDRAIYLGSSYDPTYVLDIIQYYQNTGKALGYCDGWRETQLLKDTDFTENQILSEVWIDHILDLATQRYFAGKINLDIEQALIVMLSITHFFKFEMDHMKAWYEKNNDLMEKELEDFKKAEGISDWKGEMDWILENGAVQYNICIQDLLLQTLYKLNGSYYRTHDRDYDWEEKFDEIFVDMPFGRKFDRAMISFLLLPLYNSTHNTNFIIQSDYFINHVENSNK
ncbi:MAG: hypothetical protein JXB49_13810, partial [Bacteroidales bacterium]|nr:hypothetical protein [Bacteroidales bacterium]